MNGKFGIILLLASLVYALACHSTSQAGESQHALIPDPRETSEAPPPPPPPPVPGRSEENPGDRQPPPSGGEPRPSAPRPSPRPPYQRSLSGLCLSQYSGRFLKHGDQASLRFTGSQMVLFAHGTAFNAQGECTSAGLARAAFRFALDDDRNYVFQGTISLNQDGSATLKADQFKYGQLIDRLWMARAFIQPR